VALIGVNNNNQKKHAHKENKQTKNESCPEMVARQHSRRQEQEQNIGQIMPQDSNKK